MNEGWGKKPPKDPPGSVTHVINFNAPALDALVALFGEFVSGCGGSGGDNTAVLTAIDKLDAKLDALVKAVVVDPGHLAELAARLNTASADLQKAVDEQS